MRSYTLNKAEIVLEDLLVLDAAIVQWTIENVRVSDDLPTWEQIEGYLIPDSRLRKSGGKDIYGNSYVIGTNVELVSVDLRTIEALSWSVEPDKFSIDKYGNKHTRAPEIILAARQGDVSWLRELLKAGANIDQQDLSGRTPLYWAVQQGRTEAARLICSLHTDPLQAINKGTQRLPFSTPMSEAIMGHPEIVSLFMDYGATHQAYMLPYAAQYPSVVKVLLQKGMSPDARDGIGEPILLSASYSNEESARILIEAGAKVNVSRKDGTTAIQQALRAGHPTTTDLLRTAGAKD